MTEWKEYKLGEIIEVFIDYRGKTPQKSSFGIPLITAKVVKEGRILPPNEFIPEADYDSWMTRGLPEINDVVLTTEAPLGEVALIKDNRVALAQRIITMRGKRDIVDNIFLKYYFQSKQGQYELSSRASGTTVFGIKAEVLKKVPVFLPPLIEQRRIASILSSLDDKIDLLHRENATLEQMAETLFRQWFVVEAKEEWEEGKLGDICNYVNEKIDIGNVETGDYISTENMCPNKQGVVLASSVPENGKATKYRIDDVLLSNIRPYFKKIWLSDREGGCSADVLCIRGKNELYAFFSYYTIRQDEFFDYVMLGSKGCKMPRGDKSHIMNWPIIIPPKDELLKFNEIAKQGITKIRNNNKQIQTLIQTRDGLLPKLMSNEIKV